MPTRSIETEQDRAHKKRRAQRGEAMRYVRDVALLYEGDDCLFWPFSDNGVGYGRVWTGTKTELVSRLVCEAVNGPAPPKYEAAHSCGNGHLGCISRKHLRWATSTENKADMALHGTRGRGSTHANSKLTEAEVIAIRAAIGTHAEIGAKFGIGAANVGYIRSRKSWRHVP